jgi:hypothetical protein
VDLGRKLDTSSGDGVDRDAHAKDEGLSVSRCGANSEADDDVTEWVSRR